MNTKLNSLFRSGYGLLVTGSSYLSHPFLLAVRLYWGWSFFLTGKGKLMTHDDVTAFFTTLGIPLPGLNAWMAGATECFGGLLLLAGFASRLTAIPLIITMIVAYLTADAEVVRNIFSEPDKFTGADPFLFLVASVIIFIFGPGAVSLDRLIAWLAGRKAEPDSQAAPDGRTASKTFAQQGSHAGTLAGQ
jgi:putative oxidoreductase